MIGASRIARLAGGTALALIAMLPPERHLLEREMCTHMLVQIPMLLSAGALIGSVIPSGALANRWNLAGVPALLGASFIVAFWMVPIAIDRAVASVEWDLAKGASIVFAGAISWTSWRNAPSVVQVFFAGNMVWMTVAVGILYRDTVVRLCNAYLQDDQAFTGVALTWLPGIVVAWWMVRLALSPLAGACDEPTPSPGARGNER